MTILVGASKRAGKQLTRFFLFCGIIFFMKSFDMEQAKKAAETVAKKHGLIFVALFGSQATGRTHEKSDIDIGVVGGAPIAFDAKTDIWREFSDVFHRDDIEIVDLFEAMPTIMYVVSRDGQVLYEDNLGRFASWKLYAMREWRDTEWLREFRDRKLTEWAKTA